MSVDAIDTFSLHSRLETAKVFVCLHISSASQKREGEVFNPLCSSFASDGEQNSLTELDKIQKYQDFRVSAIYPTAV